VKNFETGCHGLSPGLFVFTIMGNLTYALSICMSSMEKDHLIANASWLAGELIVQDICGVAEQGVGSLLTIFLDLIVSGEAE
jgi:solute carrier family 66 (lysosomal lysine-arginine transporter), member 1